MQDLVLKELSRFLALPDPPEEQAEIVVSAGTPGAHKLFLCAHGGAFESGGSPLGLVTSFLVRPSGCLHVLEIRFAVLPGRDHPVQGLCSAVDFIRLSAGEERSKVEFRGLSNPSETFRPPASEHDIGELTWSLHFTELRVLPPGFVNTPEEEDSSSSTLAGVPA